MFALHSQIKNSRYAKFSSHSLAEKSLYFFIIFSSLFSPTIFGEDYFLNKQKKYAALSPTNFVNKNATPAFHTNIPYVISYSSQISNPSSFLNRTLVSNNKAYSFYIQGGLHGNEKLTVDFVLWLAERVQSKSSLINLLDKYHINIDFKPIANPFGYANSLRYNENAVNLNRNFGVNWGLSRENPGQKAFSEKETQKIQNTFEQKRYLAAIDVHGYANMIVMPSFPRNIEKNSPISEKVRDLENWLGLVKKRLSLLPSANYKIKTALDLGDGGSFEDWAFWQKDSYALCLEMLTPERHFSKANDRPANTNDTFLAYEKYLYFIFKDAISLEEKRQERLQPYFTFETKLSGSWLN
ncbi:MAG: DUF2817 domain-containing protein [Oligoflexales bacterium]|nr:DUF2817 domain-containing protein [Oligoflexales bacterium]